MVFEIRADKVDNLCYPKLVVGMEPSSHPDVPLIADAGIGDNWDEAH